MGTCGGACQNDLNGDGICDDDSIPGCTYDIACNYDPSASINDGSCDFTSCYGCTDIEACNYSPEATIDNGVCWYVEEFYLNCEGDCESDVDGDGVCDELEVFGCTDEEACNFEPEATELEDSCTYPGCNDETACNFNPEAGCDDGSCVEDGDAGCIDPNACNFDESAICGDDSCSYEGCTNPLASNFDELAGCDDGSCIVYGCTVDLACNYEPTANVDDNSCEFGTCPGCTDPDDFLYNPTSSNDSLCGSWNCGDLIVHGGYSYSTEEVGGQCWMVENLRSIESLAPWQSNTCGLQRSKVWGYEGNDVQEGIAIVQSGANVYYSSDLVIQSTSLCPSGFRAPTAAEYLTLTSGQFEQAGGYINCDGDTYVDLYYNYYRYIELSGATGLIEVTPSGINDIGTGYAQWDMLLKCVSD